MQLVILPFWWGFMTLFHISHFALESLLWSAAFDPSVKEFIETSLLAVGHQGQDAGPIASNLVYGWSQLRWHSLCYRTHAIQPICARVGFWACGQRVPGDKNTGLKNYRQKQPHGLATWHPHTSKNFLPSWSKPRSTDLSSGSEQGFYWTYFLEGQWFPSDLGGLNLTVFFCLIWEGWTGSLKPCCSVWCTYQFLLIPCRLIPGSYLWICEGACSHYSRAHMLFEVCPPMIGIPIQHPTPYVTISNIMLPCPLSHTLWCSALCDLRKKAP